MIYNCRNLAVFTSSFFQYKKVNQNYIHIYIFFLLDPQRCIWLKYCNRSHTKRDFNGFSGKDYGTHGLNQSQFMVFIQVEFQDLAVLPKSSRGLVLGLKSPIFSLVRGHWAWKYRQIPFFVYDFFHTVQPIETEFKTDHYFNRMKR